MTRDKAGTGSRKAKSHAQDASDRQSTMAKAMSHPLRAEMLAELNRRGPMAPVELSHLLRAKLSTAAYHMKVLERCACVELVETKPVRGATKHTYRSTVRMWLDDQSWPELQGDAAKAGITSFIVSETLKRTRAAMEARTIDRREDRHLSTTTISVDEQGWADITVTLKEALDRVIEIEAEAATRVGGSGESFLATVNIGSFESPPTAAVARAT